MLHPRPPRLQGRQLPTRSWNPSVGSNRLVEHQPEECAVEPRAYPHCAIRINNAAERMGRDRWPCAKVDSRSSEFEMVGAGPEAQPRWRTVFSSKVLYASHAACHDLRVDPVVRLAVPGRLDTGGEGMLKVRARDMAIGGPSVDEHVGLEWSHCGDRKGAREIDSTFGETKATAERVDVVRWRSNSRSRRQSEQTGRPAC